MGQLPSQQESSKVRRFPSEGSRNAEERKLSKTPKTPKTPLSKLKPFEGSSGGSKRSFRVTGFLSRSKKGTKSSRKKTLKMKTKNNRLRLPSDGSTPEENWLREVEFDMLTLKKKSTKQLENVFKTVVYKLQRGLRHSMCTEPGDERSKVSRTQFLAMCQEVMGEDLDSNLAFALFDYMDCHRSGYVDEVEFSVITMFLLEKSTDGKDDLQLVYNMFDVDKNGLISQKEFSEMLAVLVSTSFEEIIDNHLFRPVFEKVVAESLMAESLEFFYEVHHYVGSEEQIPIDEAVRIAEKYVESKSKTAINVGGLLRAECLEEVSAAADSGESFVDPQIFLSCMQEVSNLLKTNAVPAFKNSLRTPPFSSITIDIWKRFGKDSDENLGFEEFSEWIADIPKIKESLFNFQKKFHDLALMFRTSLLQTAEAEDLL